MPHPILCCGTQRAERGRRGHGRGLEARTGSAEWRETGGTRDGLTAGPGVLAGVWRRALRAASVVGRAGQPWILLNADRAGYTKRAGRVSLMLVL